MKQLDEIEPGRLYSLAEAREFVPGPTGKPVSPRTLRRAIAAGVLKAHQRGGYWYVWGADLAAYAAPAGSVPEWHGTTPAEAKRRLARAVNLGKELGLKSCGG